MTEPYPRTPHGTPDALEELEVERKYDVDDGTAVPDLAALDAAATVAPPLVLRQTATYHDTPGFRLLHARVTLRCRVGGVDDGWHLKLPATGDARQEVRLPPGGEDGDVPEELLERVRVHVRADEVRPVVVLRTHRTVHRLLDAGGRELAELCDDRVDAETADGRTMSWREWELEVAAGPRALLDAAEPLLLRAGARPAGVGSKAARVLDGSAPPRPAWRSLPDPGPGASTAEALSAYLARHLLRLEEQDRQLRGGDQEGVHQLRVAARRLRSALATYEPVLSGGTRELREELRWLGGVLAAARDAQVLRRRLVGATGQEPGGEEPQTDPVALRLDRELSAAYHEGREEALAALSGPRYLRLVDRLEGLLEALPVAEDAPAEEVLPRLLERDRKRLLRRHRAWKRATDREEREHHLHEVRKAAKRLRYAAESATPVLGDTAADLAAGAEALQELLGEVQDTVVARQTLSATATRASEAGEDAAGYDLLHDREARRAEELTARYTALVKALPRP